MSAMRRVSQPLLMLTAAFAVCSSVTKAAAEEAGSSVTKAPAEEAGSSVTKAPAEEAGSSVTKAPAEEAGSSVTKAPAEEAGWLAGWQPGFSGYFRAPLGIAIANRPDPGNAPNSPSGTQLSFAPDHAVDGNFNSFAFTRVQETDWAEVYIHARKKHVDGAVGWGGYWFQSVGYQRPFAQWMPGFAWIRLDGDFQIAGVTPNAAVQVGAFWPTFGYFPAYDTYTMGRIRQIGERIDLTVPVTPNLKVTLTHGLGGNRNGFASVGTVPVVGISNKDTTTALDLLTYANLAVDYRDKVHLGLHWNMSWTTDPGNNAGLPIGTTFQDVRDAHLTVTAAELKLNYPRAGLLWLSPTYVQIKNGWALDPLGGVEVLHSQSGLFGANFMGYEGTVGNSTGSGSTFALGGMYENTLGGMMGRGFGTKLPDVRLDVFGLLALSRRDLTPTSNLQKDLNQFKWGASLTLQTLTWLALMLRYDQVYDASPKIHDLQIPGNDFSMLTPRLIIMSHFLSGAMVYIQYTRYFLGDAYRTAPGSTYYQFPSNPNVGYPAENVVAVSATMSW